MRRYCPSDYDEVCAWYEARGMNPPDRSMLPQVGYIVPGVAAGWLCQTDCDLAFLDGYVTHPEASKERRHDALDAITGALLEDAGNRGFKTVLVLSKDEGIIARAGRHGMELATHTYRMLRKVV